MSSPRASPTTCCIPAKFSVWKPPAAAVSAIPLERDPERVLNDVRNGYVTQKRAREVYRVAIDAVDGDLRGQRSTDARTARRQA